MENQEYYEEIELDNGVTLKVKNKPNFEAVAKAMKLISDETMGNREAI